MELWVGREPLCEYATIQAAVDASERDHSGAPAAIYVLPGVYREQVVVYRSELSIVGIGHVELVMDRYARELGDDGEEIGTFATPTLFLGGSGLRLENVTVSNTAGPGEQVGQAIALTAHCDRAVFRCCTFRGHQDTLFTGPLPPAPQERKSFGGVPIRERHARYRQLYVNCRIEGTVDYIFGGAEACFERCELRSLARAGSVSGGPSEGAFGGAFGGERGGYVTAASTPEGRSAGYLFADCVLSAEPGVPAGSVYLGRPWREHARTVFAGCRMGTHIHPAGWHDWGRPDRRRTADYREYGTQPPPAAGQRAYWAVSGAAGAYEAADWSKETMFADDWFWEADRGPAAHPNVQDDRPAIFKTERGDQP